MATRQYQTWDGVVNDTSTGIEYQTWEGVVNEEAESPPADTPIIYGETSHNELTSPWIRGWVDGDGTSQTITVHGAGVASLLDDDAYLEVHAPSEDGSYKYTMYESTRSYISDNASALTAGDSWSGSPAATYKFEITIAPDYDGPVYARVHYHKRSTDAFYVDPILVVS